MDEREQGPERQGDGDCDDGDLHFGRMLGVLSAVCAAAASPTRGAAGATLAEQRLAKMLIKKTRRCRW